jgi:hypothetical protein
LNQNYSDEPGLSAGFFLFGGAAMTRTTTVDELLQISIAVACPCNRDKELWRGPNKQDSGKHERGNQLLFVRYQTLMDRGKPNFCSIETDKTRMRGVGIVGGNDNTHYAYPDRRPHDRAVTGLWLVSLHDGKRGTRQIS